VTTIAATATAEATAGARRHRPRTSNRLMT
jgi:hypothetical protein